VSEQRLELGKIDALAVKASLRAGALMIGAVQRAEAQALAILRPVQAAMAEVDEDHAALLSAIYESAGGTATIESLRVEVDAEGVPTGALCWRVIEPEAPVPEPVPEAACCGGEAC